ncbi:MAG: twitching mobility protein, partial [Gemmatimonadota bacterium]
MPQLDRVLPRLENGATQLLLEADTPIRCVTADGEQPVSSQILSAAQVLGLIGELAGPDDKPAVMAGRNIRFLYTWNERQWLVQQDDESPQLRLRIEPWTAMDAPSDPTVPDTSRHRRRRASDRPYGPFASEQQARQTIDALLHEQVERGAADLHLRVGEPPLLRLGGDIRRIENFEPFDEETLAALIWSIMPDKNKVEFDASWDTDFAYEIEGLSRFRVNVLRDRKGVAAVLRTIANGTVTVEQMGISQEVQHLCNLTKGLVLVTGPTGSGKSTTLCALTDLMNRT